MNIPMFVIIPVYNAEKYLEKAVRSVLNQPHINIQLILVNDGSKDSSGEICDRLSRTDSRICVLHQKNGGVSKARNTGIDLALSQSELINDDAYVAFLDADDFWKQDVKWSVEDSDGADIIAYSSAISNTRGNRFKILHRYENSTFLGDGANAQWLNNGHFGAFLYRAGFLRKNNLRFLEGVTRNEDVIFWRQATFSARKIVFSPEVLYVYRMNYASVTHQNSVEHVTKLHIPQAWNRAIEWINSLPASTDIQKERWTASCHQSVGATLLESARILAECGYSVREINTIILNSPLSKDMEDLQVEWLANWQRDDLIMIRRDLGEFVKYHRKRGRWRLAGIRISKFVIVRKLLDCRKYNLSEI